MRWFKATGPACWAVLLAMLLLAPAKMARAADHTNVVLIYCDDLGWGDLGCYGHEKFRTPNIDRLAEEGARLTNFTSCCPYCAPSRTALQTGRYPFRSGLVDNPSPDPAHDELGLPDSEVTLGQLFHDAGYHTACFGKWHLGHQPQFFPSKRGYDEYFGILYSNDMAPVKLYKDTEMVQALVFQPTLTKRYTDKALAFIKENKSEPFFLYLAHAMPHKPLAASADFYGRSGAGLYGDVMAELDWSVGQVLEKLKDLDLDEKTLVLFSSDNGPWYGGSTGGLRGMKGQTWEGGLRVPLLARWPKKIPEGHVSEQPATMADLFTTGLTAAGIPLPSDRVIDGKDLMPLLTSDAPSPHEAIYAFRGQHLCTVRSGPWKLHTRFSGPREQTPILKGEPYHDPRAPDGIRILAPREQYHPSDFPGVLTGYSGKGLALFNLDDDPTEQTNVAESNPTVVQRLLGLAAKIEQQMPAAKGSKATVESMLKEDQAIAALDQAGAKLRITAAGAIEEVDFREVKRIAAAVKSLAELGDVYRVVFTDSGVTDADFEQLKDWPGPRVLELGHTSLGDAGLAPLAGFTGLTTLKLNETRISDAGVAKLAGLHELAILNLEKTDVSDAGAASLASLTRLMELNLAGTKLEDAGMAALKDLTRLESLNVSGTQVGNAGLAELKKLSRLRSLNLGHTRIGDDGLASLKAFTQLQTLDLSGTRVTDAGLVHLKSLKTLLRLNLASTAAGNKGLVNLKPLVRLQQLCVKKSGVDDAGEADLGNTLPKLQFVSIEEFADPEPNGQPQP
jgi:N-acetylgalactosamine-6-sulfatase